MTAIQIVITGLSVFGLVWIIMSAFAGIWVYRNRPDVPNASAAIVGMIMGTLNLLVMALTSIIVSYLVRNYF